MNRYSDSTLKGMTKDELIRYVRMCEHNQDVAEESLAQQYENFKTIVKDWEIKKHGKWIEIKSNDFRDNDSFFKCSLCGRTERYKEPYCNCGAKMDEEE